MSQKTNPTSLRLQKTNQNFSSPLFSDFFFTENYHYNFEIENYVTAFLKQTQYSKAFFSAKNQYRSFSAWLFLQDCRADKKAKQLFFRYKSFKKLKSLEDFSKTEVFRVLTKTKQNENTISVQPHIFQKTAKQVDSFAKVYKSQIKNLLSLRGTEISRPTDSQQINSEQWIQSKYNFLSFIRLTSPNFVIKYCQQFFHLSFFSPKLEQYLKLRFNDLKSRKSPFSGGKASTNRRFVKRFLITKSERTDLSNNKDIEKQVLKNEAPNLKLRFKLLRNYLENHFLRLKPNAFFSSSDTLRVPRVSAKWLQMRMQPLIENDRLQYNEGHLVKFGGLSLLKPKSGGRNDKSVYESWWHNHYKSTCIPPLVFAMQKHAKITSRIMPFECLPVPVSDFVALGKNDNYKKMKIKQSKKEELLSNVKQSFRCSNPNFFEMIRVQPIRFIRDRQNVMSLLDQIIILLEKRVAWRQIKSFLFRDLSKDLQISGVRFSCSGRLGGRSKKAQKAKTQCASFGETSLSAFSSKLIFGSKSAFTPYGKIGVKLWICYRC